MLARTVKNTVKNTVLGTDDKFHMTRLNTNIEAGN